MRAVARAAGAAGLAFVVAACAGGSAKVACPSVAIVPELKSVAKFGPGPGRNDSDALYGAWFLGATDTCSADKKKGGVAVSTKIAIASLRAKTEIRKGQVSYFVAVVDRNRTILNKRDFSVDLEFPAVKSRLDISEEVEEFIYLPKDRNGADYVILIGFALTPEELQYNREHLRGAQG